MGSFPEMYNDQFLVSQPYTALHGPSHRSRSRLFCLAKQRQSDSHYNGDVRSQARFWLRNHSLDCEQFPRSCAECTNVYSAVNL